MSEPSQTIRSAIADAARLTGVSASYLHAAARRESNFDPQARASTSSAAGLYQFIESTWLETLSRHGDALGVAADAEATTVDDPRDAALALRFDPRAAALMAGALARDNAETLEARLGRAPDAGELYAAHVLGASGAARLFETVAEAPDRSAAEVFPAAAEANTGLFYTADGTAVSVSALSDRLTAQVSASAPLTAPAAPTSLPSRNVIHVSGEPLAPVRTVMLRGASAPLHLSAPVVEALARLDAPESARERAREDLRVRRADETL